MSEVSDVVEIGEFQTETLLLLDGNGNPLGVTPKPHWDASSSFLGLVPSADGSSCVVTAVGKVGQSGAVNVTFNHPGGGGQISRSIHCVIVESFTATIIPASKHLKQKEKKAEHKTEHKK